MVSFRSASSRALLLLILAAPLSLAASTAQFQVLLDTDNNASTGCSTEMGGIAIVGVEQILTTTVEVTSAGSNVTGVTRQVCAAGAFGAPIVVDATGWPVGTGGGNNTSYVETHIPLSAFGGSLPAVQRLYFAGTVGSFSTMVTIDDDRRSILFPRPHGRRRAADPDGGSRGRRRIILDGQVGDWNGLQPLLSNDNNPGTGAIRFGSIYAFAGNDLFFRFDVRLNLTAPIAVDDTYQDRQGAALIVPAPGVLANDLSPTGATLRALIVSQPQHGTVTLSANGGFVYVNDGSNASVDQFTYKANDGTADSNVAKVTINITADSPPIANNDSYSVPHGGTINVPAPGVLGNDTDPDGDPLTAALQTGPLHGSLLLSANGSFTYTHDGTSTLTDSFVYRASDGFLSAAATVTLTITNTPPAITSANNTTFTAGSPNSFTVTVTGFPTPTVTETGALPPGVTFNPVTNTLSGTPGINSAGTYPITFTASNGVLPNATQNFTLTVVCPAITVTNPSSTTATAGTPFSQTFTQTGASGTATFTTTSTLPMGLTLSTAGVLSGTPMQSGTFPIVVKVTDSNNCVGTGATYTLIVSCQTITVTNPATTTGTAGTAFSQTFTQSGAVGGATFTTASTLPMGLTLSTAGVLSGTPAQTGTFPIVVTVTDGNGCTGTGATYNLVIGCQTITVTNPATSTGTAGTAFSQTFTQTGAIGTATFTLNSGTLPAGLTLSTAGVLSGTPAVTGSFPITVKVTDGNGCTGTGATYTLVINCQTITVTNPATTTGTVNTPFSQTFTAGNTIGTVTFTTTSTLPAGLSLSTAGVLSGTPMQTGTFPIVVKATDANGCFGNSATYNLVIGCQVITVTNPSTTTGTISSPFSQTFTASNTVGSVTFTTASALPIGLSLSTGGVLSGTPAQTGTFPIVVTATDANGCSGNGATYNLVISCQTITVTNPPTNTGTAGTMFSQSFSQSGAIGGATFTSASPLPNGITFSTAGLLAGTPTQFGTFPINVTVTDSNGCKGTSSGYTLVISCQTITVTNPPTNTGTVGTMFSQSFSQSGAIGGATFTTASTLPNGLLLAPSGTLSGTPSQFGTFNIVVTVTDGNGCTGNGSTYALTISCGTITVTNPATSAGTAGTAFSQTFTQAGGFGTTTFSTTSTLPNGLSLSSGGVLSGTPMQSGTFPIVVKATDSAGCTGTGPTYTLIVGCQTITVTNPGVTTGTVNTPFSQSFTQSGAIGGATFSTTSLLPAGLSLSTAGVLSGTPMVPGNFPIVVKVTDGNGCTGTGTTYNLVIGCQVIIVSNPANNFGTVNAAFSEQFTQTGAVGAATFTTASTLPTGFTLATNGILSGTTMQRGPFTITVTVTDSNGCTGMTTYDLVINCQTINVTNPVNNTGTVGAPFSATFTQTGALSGATFTTASTLPNGITLTASGVNAGLLAGTPTQSGTFPIVVTVTDGNGCTGTGATYTLVIACNVIMVSNPATSTGTVDAPFSQTFTQSGGNGAVTFALNSGTLPSGLMLSSGGVLSGTPGQPGSFPITVKVTDVNGCTGIGATYTLVMACQTITVTNPVTTTGTVDAPFSQSFAQTGVGTHTPAVFTVNSGSLPAGLTLSAAGLLSGTPGAPGTFPITVKVTDANGCSGISATYTLVIACQTITVANPVVTSGTFNAPFSQTFTQSGVGTHTPANFTLNSGTLPTGLTLSSAGVLSGTPAQTGTFPITVKVTDANGCSGIGATYNLAINPNVTNDSYSNLVDNTQAFVTGGATATPATPAVSLSGSLTSNDAPAGGVSVTAGTFGTTAGGSVTLAADGTFLYTPKANPGAAATTSDSFTYTATSNTGGTATPTTANGTVTLTLVNRVWYVKDNGGAGNGQSQAPFNTLAAVQAAAIANDIIFIYTGTTVTTPLSGGLSLQNGAKLWGEAFGLTVNGNVLVAAGATQPRIRNTAGAAVTVDTSAATAGNRQNVEIRGLDLESTTTNGVNVTSNAANVTSVTISGNNVRGAGTQGINLNQGSTGAFDATISATSITSVGNGIQGRTNTAGTMTITASSNTITASAGNGVDIQTLAGASALRISLDTEGVTASGTGILINGAAAGTTTITSFLSNSISGNTGGTGISVTSATFDANAGTVAFDTVSGGTTVIGVSGNGVGANGMILTTVKGDLSFTDLDIFNDGGTGLFASAAAAFNAGTGTGFQITASGNNGTITSIAGPAADLNTVTANLQLTSISSTNSAVTGVSLVTVPGTFTAGAGSITNATGTDFNINGSNATVTYGGTITDTSGRVVSIASTTGGTKSFSGAITNNGGTGVSLTNNTGATINFSGTIILSTGSSDAFTATGGGTVSASNTNSTLTTTTGTAANIANTTIGGAGVIFKSVSVNGAPNGIVLNSTGNGAFTIAGDGGAANNGSGGTIQSTTGDGILMTNVSNISLGYLNITNPGLTGIKVIPVGWTFSPANSSTSNGVTNFTLNRCNISDNAGAVTSDDGLTLSNSSGNVSITDDVFTAARHQGITIDNFSRNMASLTLTGTSVTGTPGGDGILMQMRGTSVLTSGTISSNTTSNNSATGLQVSNSDTANILSLTVQTNTVSGNNAGMDFDLGQSSSMTVVAQSNTFTNQTFQSINLFSDTGSTTGTMTATLRNNTIGTLGVQDSGSKKNGNGIYIHLNGGKAGSITVDGNVIQEVPNASLLSVEYQAYGTGSTMKLKVTNNQLKKPTAGTANGFCGPPATVCPSSTFMMFVDSNNPGVFSTICSTISGNQVFDPTSGPNGAGLAAFQLGVRTAGNALRIEGTQANARAQIITTNTITNPGPTPTASDVFVDSGTPAIVPAGNCGSFPP